MDDIFTQIKEGNALNVRLWLDHTENDLNQGDDHHFSLLHWACMEGHLNIVDMLLQRGARVNATNMGDDTPLHVAASRGHNDIVNLLLQSKASVNAANEHGNTPLHYACFWNYQLIAENLIANGALVAICNKYGDTPIDKCKPHMAAILKDSALKAGQELDKILYEDRNIASYKARSRDATLSRNAGIDLNQLNLRTPAMCVSHSGTLWRGQWQGSEIVAKVLTLKQCTVRMARDFGEEFPRLRIFNNPNILPVLAVSSHPPNLVLVSQFMPFGSLYNVLHGEIDIVVDQNQALRFAMDVAKGMEYLHSLDPLIQNFCLTSKHVMIDEDLTARINMGDYKFSFHEKYKHFSPAWVAPEALLKRADEINTKAADMWSFSILLWELATREVPFSDKSPMEVGMKVALEQLRLTIPTGTSSHMSKMIKICMNEDPGKRPHFDMIIPILEKMKLSA